jgi:Ni/Fe-hydrogenase subunit HybB-like protein
MLPLLFYVSAIGAGLGMIIVESHLSGRAFGRKLELDLLEPLGRAMVVVLAVFGVLRLQSLARGGALSLALQPTYEGRMFLVEFGLGVVLPVALLAWPRIRNSSTGLVTGAALAVLGFIMHRLDVSVTGLERASGTHYAPTWMEVMVSVGLVAIGFAAFALAVRFLPVFPVPGHSSAVRSAPGRGRGAETPGGGP